MPEATLVIAISLGVGALALAVWALRRSAHPPGSRPKHSA